MTAFRLPRRSLLRNSISLIVGRLGLSATRLLAAVAIARLAGAEIFGEYIVVMSVVAIFEWLVDGGQTDIAVRQICRTLSDEATVLADLARLKMWSGVVFALALPLVAKVLGYPRAVIEASAVAALAVLAYGLLQVDRTMLRVHLRPDIDIAAEVGGVLVMLPLTAWAAAAHGSLALLLAAYATARVVHALILRVATLRMGLPRPAARPGDTARLVWASLPLGAAGLLVASYDGLAPIMLSKLASFHDVAEYGAANRFAMPVITIVTAIGGVFFPVLAQMSHDPVRLAETQTAALWLSLLVSAAIAAGLYCAAPAVLAWTGLATVNAIATLRLMCWLVMARAVSTTMSPLIVIGNRQGRGLVLTLASLLVQAAAIPLLVPAYGIRGVVLGYLVIELVLGIVPITALGLQATRIRLDWWGPARVGVAAIAAVVCAQAIGGSTLVAGAGAGLLTVVFSILGGRRTRERLSLTFALLRQNRSVQA